MEIRQVKSLRINGISWDGLFIVLFACFLPFDNAFCNLVAGAYGLYLILYLIIVRRLPNSVEIRTLNNAKYLLLQFFVLLISILYSENKIAGLSVVMKSITLLAIPVFFALIRIKKVERRTVLLFFVWSNFAAFLANFIRATWRSFRVINDHVVFDSSVFGGQEFWYSIVQGGNFFFIDEFSTFYHPTYWSMYLLFSITIILYFFQIKNFKFFRTKLLYGMILFFLLLGIFMCSSRIIMGGTVLVMLIYFAHIFIQKKSYVFIIVGLIICGAMGILIMNSPRMGGFSNLNNYLNYNLRVQSWRAGFNILKESPIIGSGVGDAESRLMSEYSKLGYLENRTLELNEHNQYLQIANQSGMIGLFIFLMTIISGFSMAIKNRNFLQFGFIFVMAMVCMVESFLSRQAGTTFFAFFYCLLFMNTAEHSGD